MKKLIIIIGLLFLVNTGYSQTGLVMSEPIETEMFCFQFGKRNGEYFLKLEFKHGTYCVQHYSSIYTRNIEGDKEFHVVLYEGEYKCQWIFTYPMKREDLLMLFRPGVEEFGVHPIKNSPMIFTQKIDKELLEQFRKEISKIL